MQIVRFNPQPSRYASRRRFGVRNPNSRCSTASASAPRNAALNVSTWNPGTKSLANLKITALITRKKIPNVNIPSGSVITFSSSPNVALNNPITITANSADFNPSITNPFTKCATINSAAAFNTQCNSIRNISVLLAVAFLFVIPEGNLLLGLSFPKEICFCRPFLSLPQHIRILHGDSHLARAARIILPADIPPDGAVMSPARIALLLSFLTATALLPAQPPPAPAATAAQPPDSSASIPTIHVTSRLVVLDVVVSDGHGRSIKGLKPSDFTLTEDGVLQKLSGFTELDATAEAPPAEAAPEPFPPDTFAVQPPIAGDLPRTVIVLGALSFANAPQARYDLKKFMKTAPPGVPIAIFEGDWKGIHLIQDFTTDPEVLQEAANSQRILPPIRVRPTLPSDFPPLPGDRPPDARGLASYLASIPGRINLIWISDGGAPIGEITSEFPDVSNFLHDLNGATNVLHLSRIAVYPIDANGVTVPSGNRADFDLDPLFRNPITAPLVTTPGELGSWALQGTGFFSSHGTSLTQEHPFGCVNLADLAAATGGRAFCNTNGYAQAIAEVVETGSHYYTISYTPTNPDWNGAIRRIHIDIPRDLLQAHESASEKLQDALDSMVEQPPRIEYRNSYRARSAPDAGPDAPDSAQQRTLISYSPNGDPGTRRVAPIQAAMALGASAPDAIHFTIAATPSPKSEKLPPGASLPRGNYLAPGWRDQPYRDVQLHFSIDPKDFRFTENGGLHRDALELVAVLYRDDGAVVNTFSRKFSINVDGDGYNRILSAPLALDQNIAIPVEGNYYLRTAVHEIPTDRIGAIEIPTEWIKLAPPQAVAAQ